MLVLVFMNALKAECSSVRDAPMMPFVVVIEALKAERSDVSFAVMLIT